MNNLEKINRKQETDEVIERLKISLENGPCTGQKDWDAFYIAKRVLERQMPRNPQTNPPTRTGTYLVRDVDGNYRDADWLEGRFWIKTFPCGPHEPILTSYIAVWWPLPEVQE